MKVLDVLRPVLVLSIGTVLVWWSVTSAGDTTSVGKRDSTALEWSGKGTFATEYFRKTESSRLKWSVQAGDGAESLQIETVKLNGELISTPVNAEGSGKGIDEIGGDSGFISLRMLASNDVKWRVTLIE